MPQATIDDKTVEVPEGTTIMQASQQAGIEIPALCHVKGVRPLTSCMICMVKETTTGRTLSACSAHVEDGMVIETENDEIRAARREILQLLLSEHAGDCEAPCRRICPADLDVPLMMRMIAASEIGDAARLAKEALVFPATLGWVCSAPCERGCHRGSYDEALMIRDAHRQLAEDVLKRNAEPSTASPNGKRIAIVGGGVTGLTAAFILAQRGHACRVFEKAARLGGPLLELSEEELPREVFEAEVDEIVRLGATLETKCEVGEDLPLETLVEESDAVILTCDDFDDDEDNVFSAFEYPLAVNSVAEGKEVAEQVDRFLRNLPAEERTKSFDCRLGTIEEKEKAPFLVSRADPVSVPKERQPRNLEAEAGRCLSCDCRKPVSCRLRTYATKYKATQHAYPNVHRPRVEPAQRSGDVLFEPGKCIKCGLCVEIAKEAGEELGVTFVDRGFQVRVAVPFNRTLEEGLKTSARACAEACPTGALALRDGEERRP